MNTLINMNPWDFLDDIFNDRGQVFRSMRARAAGRFPPVNVFLDDNAMIVDLQLPGKSAKDVDLTLEAQAVTVADRPCGESCDKDKETAGKAPAWSRRIELPFRVDAAKANAKFTDGILRIELPKAEADGVRKIAIA